SRLPHLLDALRARHDAFHAAGCRLSDHGLERCFDRACNHAEAGRIFDRARSGEAVDPESASAFGGHLMLFFGALDAQRGWTKQLHLGAMRNINTHMMGRLGPDTGFDAIGDWPQARSLAAYLDMLARAN